MSTTKTEQTRARSFTPGSDKGEKEGLVAPSGTDKPQLA